MVNRKSEEPLFTLTADNAPYIVNSDIIGFGYALGDIYVVYERITTKNGRIHEFGDSDDSDALTTTRSKEIVYCKLSKNNISQPVSVKDFTISYYCYDPYKQYSADETYNPKFETYVLKNYIIIKDYSSQPQNVQWIVYDVKTKKETRTNYFPCLPLS